MLVTPQISWWGFMKKRTDLCDAAARRFSGGYNCAQSVLLTMVEHWSERNELIPKIATAFGGGIGMCGSVCGALTGGVMAIGIKYGSNEPSHVARLTAYEIAQRFYEEFRQRNGSVFCRELTGYDLTKPEEEEKARNARVFDEKCTNLVRSAVEILLQFDEDPNG
jgi:C_GCAxxG_C_C family probable redox protein